MSRKDIILLQSLIDYVNDVKPYHTKFREVTSQIFFGDKLNVNVKEAYSLETHLQNVWTRDDLGGSMLYGMSEGLDSDRTYRLPATIFPRFSLNDAVGQTPVGDDPATLDFADVDQNGVPDSEDPWLGVKTPSHQRQSDAVPVNAPVISVSQEIVSEGPVSGHWEVISNLTIIIDDVGELIYGFDPFSYVINDDR